ncbi:MAG TPA: PQQ-dependent sugar dehydrogenase [Vicinamibacterales bacterium]|nr:PQQ-dependent sugar dehydrogenase [Vicinamibacterales bacterium]
MFRPGIILAAIVLLSNAAQAQQLRSLVYASGFSQPVAFIQDPSNIAIQYVVEQAGRIRLINNGVVQAAPFLNLTNVVLSGGERGLLGLAFAPDYATSGRFYVNFTRQPDGHTVVARFRRSTDPLTADPSSRFDLVWSTGQPFIVQPFANHNGGCLAFGPDGFLYVALGDGGSGNDPDNNAQRTDQLLGKMLRIDVNVADGHPQGFSIPPGNPGFARPEIWSLGLRNPWKFSFDDLARGGTGAMVIGDVGQSAWEEVDYEPRGRAGRNYGWRNREGAHNNVTSIAPSVLPLVDPIFEYGRSEGGSISGGHIYRGNEMAGDRGRYFFADFVSRRIWSIALNVNATTGEATASDLVEHTTELGGQAAVGNVSGFGVDSRGEIYFINYSAGAIHRLTRGPATPANLRIIR